MLQACLASLLVLLTSAANAQLATLSPADMFHATCLVSVIPTPLYKLQTPDNSVRYRTALNITVVLTRHNGYIDVPWNLSLAGPYLAVAPDVDLNLVNLSLSDGESSAGCGPKVARCMWRLKLASVPHAPFCLPGFLR